MYLEPPSKFFVKKKARELSSARPLQELNEDLPQRTLHFVSSLLELLVSDEMGLVVVSLELLQQRLEFGLVEVLVNLGVEKGLHLIKISGVKPWGQKGFFDVGRFGSFLAAGAFFCRRGSRGGRRRHLDGGEPRTSWWIASKLWAACTELGDRLYKGHFRCHFRFSEFELKVWDDKGLDL